MEVYDDWKGMTNAPVCAHGDIGLMHKFVALLLNLKFIYFNKLIKYMN